MPAPFATIIVSPALISGPRGAKGDKGDTGATGATGPSDHSYTDTQVAALQAQIDSLAAQIAAIGTGGGGGPVSPSYGVLDFSLSANSGFVAAIGA